jgi:hypothetical protein
MIDAVDSSVNRAGEMFHASLAAPIVIGNEVIVSAGTDVYLRLVNAASAGRMTGRSELSLELARMEFQGRSYILESSVYEQEGASTGKSTATKVGVGAAVGGVLGGLIGNRKGAAIGAATGAGAGTIAQAATKGEQIRIEPETKLDFTISQPLELSYFPDRNSAR